MADPSDAHKRAHPVVIDLTGDEDDQEDNRPPPKRVCHSTPPTRSPIVEAAASGNTTHLVQMLQNYRGDVSEAMNAAANNGHGGCVEFLTQYFCEPWDDEYNISLEGLACMRTAIAFAARNGHLPVVEAMLTTMTMDGEEDQEATMIAFRQGVVSGQLAVVQYAAQFIAHWYQGFQRHVAAAMETAVSKGYAIMVLFLLSWQTGNYNVDDVVEMAIAQGQPVVVENIYEAYPELRYGRNLFVEMAAAGNTDVVKYLYEHGHDGAMLVEEAMRRATINKCTGVVAFLHAAGAARPSLETSARAF